MSAGDHQVAGSLASTVASGWRDGAGSAGGAARRWPHLSAGRGLGAGDGAVLSVAGAVCHLPVLVWLIDRVQRAPRAAMVRLRSGRGWWFGFGYFLLGLFWIGEAFLVEAERFAVGAAVRGDAAAGGPCVVLSGGRGCCRQLSRPGVGRVVALALALSATRMAARAYPDWLSLEHARLCADHAVAVDAGGGAGRHLRIDTGAVLIFAAPGVLLAGDRAATSFVRRWPIAVLPLAAMRRSARCAWRCCKPTLLPGVRVRIVQPSVPQREKWLPENQRQIFFDHIELSQRSPDGALDEAMADITHVIWPEAAMPFRPLQSPEALAMIGEMLPPGRASDIGRTANCGDGSANSRRAIA